MVKWNASVTMTLTIDYEDIEADTEEEAIHKVVASAKDGGWVPCSERLPQEDEPVTALCEIVNITLKNGAVTVGWCNRFLEKWYVLDEHCDYPIPCKYEDVIAWQPLPAPYQKGEPNE